MNFVHRKQIGDRFVEGTQRLVVVQVSDVLADESLAFDDQRDCVLQIGAQQPESGGSWEGW